MASSYITTTMSFTVELCWLWGHRSHGQRQWRPSLDKIEWTQVLFANISNHWKPGLSLRTKSLRNQLAGVLVSITRNLVTCVGKMRYGKLISCLNYRGLQLPTRSTTHRKTGYRPQPTHQWWSFNYSAFCLGNGCRCPFQIDLLNS